MTLLDSPKFPDSWIISVTSYSCLWCLLTWISSCIYDATSLCLLPLLMSQSHMSHLQTIFRSSSLSIRDNHAYCILVSCIYILLPQLSLWRKIPRSIPFASIKIRVCQIGSATSSSKCFTQCSSGMDLNCRVCCPHQSLYLQHYWI